MYRDQYARTWDGPHPFTLEAITAHARAVFGVYQVLYTSGPDPQVAYIGIATGDTIRGRLKKHVRERGNWALARLGNPANFRFVFYPCDAQTAREIESYVVTMAKPPFNVRPELRHLIPSIAIH